LAGTHTDTLTQDGVTSYVRIKDTVYVTKKIPIRTTKTVNIHDTVTNDRAITYWQNDDNIKTDSLKITKHDLVNSKKSASKGWLYFWILVGSLVIIIVAKVIIFFYGGGWANTIKNVI